MDRGENRARASGHSVARPPFRESFGEFGRESELGPSIPPSRATLCAWGGTIVLPVHPAPRRRPWLAPSFSPDRHLCRPHLGLEIRSRTWAELETLPPSLECEKEFRSRTIPQRRSIATADQTARESGPEVYQGGFLPGGMRAREGWVRWKFVDTYGLCSTSGSSEDQRPPLGEEISKRSSGRHGGLFLSVGHEDFAESRWITYLLHVLYVSRMIFFSG